MQATQQEHKKPVLCANCETELMGKFCHKCGEKKVSRKDFAVANFAKEVLEKFTHLDSKLLRTLKWLIIRPGFLTVEFLRGRRKGYLKPLSLFFIINLLYFFSIHYNGFRTYETPLQMQFYNYYGSVVKTMLNSRFSESSEAAKKDFEENFDRQNHTLSKSMLLLIVPMLAAVLWLLYRRQGVYYGEHLITAIHFMALMLVQNMALGIVLHNSISTFIFNPVPEIIIEMIEPLLWIFGFAFFTFKTVYKESVFRTAAKTAVLTLMWMPILILYRFLVFLATYYTV